MCISFIGTLVNDSGYHVTGNRPPVILLRIICKTESQAVIEDDFRNMLSNVLFEKRSMVRSPFYNG